MFCNGLVFYFCWLGALWIAGRLAKRVGGADWGKGWFAVECGLVLTAGVVVELFWREKFFLLC